MKTKEKKNTVKKKSTVSDKPETVLIAEFDKKLIALMKVKPPKKED